MSITEDVVTLVPCFLLRMNTFEQILDQVSELLLDQQELLIDSVQRRTRDARRQELAKTSQEALAEYRTGKLIA